MDVYEDSIFDTYLPCIIYGKDKQGNRYQPHTCSTKDLNLTVKNYRERHPAVVRIIMDVALGKYDI